MKTIFARSSCALTALMCFAYEGAAGTVTVDFDVHLTEATASTRTVDTPRRLTATRIDVSGILTSSGGSLQPNVTYRSSLIAAGSNALTISQKALQGPDGRAIVANSGLVDWSQTFPPDFDGSVSIFVQDDSNETNTEFSGRVSITFESPIRQDVVLRFPEGSETTPFDMALINEASGNLETKTAHLASSSEVVTPEIKEGFRSRVQQLFDDAGANVRIFLDGNSEGADPEALVVSVLDVPQRIDLPNGYRLNSDVDAATFNNTTNGVARVLDELPSAVVFPGVVGQAEVDRVADVIAHETAHMVLVNNGHFEDGGIMEAVQADNVNRRFMPDAAEQLRLSTGVPGELFLPGWAPVMFAGSFVRPNNVSQIQTMGLLTLMPGSENNAFWEIVDLDWTYDTTLNVVVPEFEGLGALLASSNGASFDYAFMPSGEVLPLGEMSVSDFALISFDDFLSGGFETSVLEFGPDGQTYFGSAFASSVGVPDNGGNPTGPSPVPVPGSLALILAAIGSLFGIKRGRTPRSNQISLVQ